MIKSITILTATITLFKGCHTATRRVLCAINHTLAATDSTAKRSRPCPTGMRTGAAITLAIALLLLFTSTAYAQDAQSTVTKPTVPIERGGCVTAACHPTVKDYKVVHGPVNVDACDACHELTDAKQHTFKQIREDETLCTFCHTLEDRIQSVMHKPVTDGDCIACHDPHGGFDNHALRGDSVDSLCQQCHEDATDGKSQVHGPVAAGACAGCHAAHSSPNKHLLLAKGNEMCLTCHKSTEAQLAEMRFVHGPVNVDCLACHDAHASDHKMMLHQATKPLCLTCHDTVADAIMNSPRQHAPVSDQESCLNCHTAHASDLAGILKVDPQEICFNCHDKAIQIDEQRSLSDIKTVVANSEFKHGPVVDSDCGACHDVHGGKHFSLLIEEYPAKFYAPFEEDNYNLCFTCHDRQLVHDAETDKLTNFRNGEQNLHFLHVNKSKKGRTCRACHETHASNNDLHVRDAVPFGRGGWSLPIGYEKLEAGGSCSPGCHIPYEYNRDNPVDYTPAEDPEMAKKQAKQPGPRETETGTTEQTPAASNEGETK